MTVQHDALIKVFSYYRDAEMRGASLLIKMMARIKDPEAQVLFSRHIHDETRHAWLWTKRIKDEGSLPVEVPDGYQRRLGKALGIPTSILDLFALTVIVEERAHKRYAEHAASPLCDDKTLAVLSDVTKDEKWHVAWMEDYLVTLAKGPRAGAASEVGAAVVTVSLTFVSRSDPKIGVRHPCGSRRRPTVDAAAVPVPTA